MSCKARSVINVLVNLERFYEFKIIKVGSELKKCAYSCAFDLWFLSKGTQLRIRIAKNPKKKVSYVVLFITM